MHCQQARGARSCPPGWKLRLLRLLPLTSSAAADVLRLPLAYGRRWRLLPLNVCGR